MFILEICKICDKQFKGKRGLNNHLRSHDIFPYKYKKQFPEHKYNGEALVDFVICPICNERFLTLRYHLSKAHSLNRKQIDNLDCSLVCDKQKEVYATQAKNSWSDADEEKRKLRCEKISKTKSENWTEKDSEFLATCRKNIPGLYSKIGKKRLGKLREKFDTEEEFNNHLTERLLPYARGQAIEYTTRDLNEIVLRSTWEMKVAQILDSLQVKYLYEYLRIPYYFANKLKVYLPDFYIPDRNLILEVKPEELIDEKVFAKRLATVDKGYVFKFVHHKHLSEDKIKNLLV